MEIIKKKKLKQLKACRKACKQIYDLMVNVSEDEHGNASPYRWDKVHKDILDTLKGVGFGRAEIVGIGEWEYQLPWPVNKASR